MPSLPVSRSWLSLLLVACCSTCLELRFTQQEMRLRWSPGRFSPPVTGRAENLVAKALVIPGEYTGNQLLSPERVAAIERSCASSGMRVEQALSMRKQLLVQKILHRSSALRKDLPAIQRSYNKGMSILRLSESMDQPPVAMFRLLLYDRVRNHFPDLLERDVKLLMKDALREQGVVYESLMDDRDRDELQSAKLYDQTSYSVDPNERLASLAWELALYAHLDELGNQCIMMI